MKRLLAIVSLGLVGACASDPGTDRIIATPVTVQIAAHEACQAQIIGRTIPQAIDTLELRNGGAIVSVLNGPSITLSQARSINQCARARLLAQSSVEANQMVLKSEDTYVAPKGAYNARSRFDAEMRHPKMAPGSATCYDGAPLLFRGTLYCPKH